MADLKDINFKLTVVDFFIQGVSEMDEVTVYVLSEMAQ